MPAVDKPRLVNYPWPCFAVNKASRLRKRTGVAKTALKKPTVRLPHIPRPEDILAGDIRVDSQIVLEREIASLTIQLWWRKLQAKKYVCLAIQHALAERPVFRDCYNLYTILVSVRLRHPAPLSFPRFLSCPLPTKSTP